MNAEKFPPRVWVKFDDDCRAEVFDAIPSGHYATHISMEEHEAIVAKLEAKLKVAVEDLEWIEYRSETARHRALASGLRPTMASPNQIAMHAREALIRLRARK